MRHLLQLLLVAMSLQAPLAAARQADVDALSAALASIQSYSADFEQTIYDQHQRVVQRSRGELQAARPGRLRWESAEPFAQLIVVDGEHIWRYEADLEQVIVGDYTDDLGNTPALLLSGDVSSIAARYQVSRSGSRYTLLPRDPESLFRRMEVDIKRHKLTRLELSDSLGQTTVLELRKIRLNPQLSASLFAFTPPEGVDVLRDE